MRTIRIERYPADDINPDHFVGLIEGQADNGRSWIMFLDSDGMPANYWPDRDASGVVIGEAIDLRRTE